MIALRFCLVLVDGGDVGVVNSIGSADEGGKEVVTGVSDAAAVGGLKGLYPAMVMICFITILLRVSDISVFRIFRRCANENEGLPYGSLKGPV